MPAKDQIDLQSCSGRGPEFQGADAESDMCQIAGFEIFRWLKSCGEDCRGTAYVISKFKNEFG